MTNINVQRRFVCLFDIFSAELSVSIFHSFEADNPISNIKWEKVFQIITSKYHFLSSSGI